MSHQEAPNRLTVSKLVNGLYNYDGHKDLGDHGMRRYHPFSMEFDSTPMDLKEPGPDWSDEAKRAGLERRARLVEHLEARYGARNIETVVRNLHDLGPKNMSLISYHNTMYEQARTAFVVGAYYPALLAACALAERILNHLILDLRQFYLASSHYRKVHEKKSFDNWQFAVNVLTDWKVLVEGVGQKFLDLTILRNRSVHFNLETYDTTRDDALSALLSVGEIISDQFGYFRRQPWFIKDTPGAQFISRAYENDPFVRTYLIPASGFVGPLYGMHIMPQGNWIHLDYDDYGDGLLNDEDFAKAFRERDHNQVVTIAMTRSQAK